MYNFKVGQVVTVNSDITTNTGDHKYTWENVLGVVTKITTTTDYPYHVKALELQLHLTDTNFDNEPSPLPVDVFEDEELCPAWSNNLNNINHLITRT